LLSVQNWFKTRYLFSSIPLFFNPSSLICWSVSIIFFKLFILF
jgi:hypothetical protein